MAVIELDFGSSEENRNQENKSAALREKIKEISPENADARK